HRVEHHVGEVAFQFFVDFSWVSPLLFLKSVIFRPVFTLSSISSSPYPMAGIGQARPSMIL
ncbi:hypothetical protein, partial [Acutalibacter muris]|uniref:hypothetical protein n=1 Tax=Acutalibacter muris TaxID=1796620 RepID=UPI00272EB904